MKAKDTLHTLGFFAAMDRPGIWVSDNGMVTIHLDGEIITFDGQTFTPEEFWNLLVEPF